MSIVCYLCSLVPKVGTCEIALSHIASYTLESTTFPLGLVYGVDARDGMYIVELPKMQNA